MTGRVAVIFVMVGLLHAACSSQSVSIPAAESCEGVWEIEAVKSDSYYALPFKRYPVELDISQNQAVFTDNHGGACSVLFFQDSEANKIAFKHCFPTSHADMLPQHYIIGCKDGRLSGEVRNFKHMFDIKGRKTAS